MKDIIGLINLQCPNTMKELSAKRPLASEPFGAKFRLMDFALSNMVNAGIDTVGLILPFHSRSVLDHVRSAKEWDLARKQHGLYYLPMDEEDEILHPKEGDIYSYYKNLRYVEAGQCRYLLLSGCDVVANIDYEKVMRFHRKHNANITLVYKKQETDCTGDGYILKTKANGLVTEMKKANGVKKDENLFLGVVLMDSGLFLQMIRRANIGGKWKFFNDVLADNTENLRIFGYSFEGYAKRINSLNSYYQGSMDMLKLENWRDIFHQDQRIYTKIKDEAPAKYMEEAHVTNSLVANGCIIEGTVENSILFRKVRVGRNAVIRNSIVMQNTNVGEDACLNYVICDKDRDIQPEAVLEGTEKEPLCIIKHEVR